MATVYLIAGPSGSGKTSLVDALLKDEPRLARAITCTTRRQRPGEVNGIDYYFVTHWTFYTLNASGCFVNADCIFNEFYGVPHASLEGCRHKLLIVSAKGALDLARQLPNSVTLFIWPADLRTAEERVKSRYADNERPRLDEFQTIKTYGPRFDSIIVNDDFTQALAKLRSIIDARLLDDEAALCPSHSSGEPQHV